MQAHNEIVNNNGMQKFKKKIFPLFYFVLKNLVLPRSAGSSMGHACPALRGSEFSGSA
jgi:hypothetical protein